MTSTVDAYSSLTISLKGLSASVKSLQQAINEHTPWPSSHNPGRKILKRHFAEIDRLNIAIIQASLKGQLVSCLPGAAPTPEERNGIIRSLSQAMTDFHSRFAHVRYDPEYSEEIVHGSKTIVAVQVFELICR